MDQKVQVKKEGGEKLENCMLALLCFGISLDPLTDPSLLLSFG